MDDSAKEANIYFYHLTTIHEDEKIANCVFHSTGNENV